MHFRDRDKVRVRDKDRESVKIVPGVASVSKSVSQLPS